MGALGDERRLLLSRALLKDIRHLFQLFDRNFCVNDAFIGQLKEASIPDKGSAQAVHSLNRTFSARGGKST